MNQYLPVPLYALLLLTTTTDMARAHEYEAYARTALGTSRAYAGESVRSDDASVAFANPAAIANLESSQWSGAFHAMTFRARAHDFAATYDDADTVPGASDGDGGGVFGGPALYYVSTAVAPVYFGVSFLAPYAYGTDYERDWAGRYAGTYSELAVFSLAPVVAYKPSRQWSIGLALPLNAVNLKLQRVLNQPGRCAGLEQRDDLTAGACAAVGLLPGAKSGDGVEKTKTRGWSMGATLAAHFTGSSGDWRVGAVYRLQEEIDLHGKSEFLDVHSLLQSRNLMRNSDIDSELVLPAAFTLSGALSASDNVTLYADVTWKNWSTFKGWRIEYKDSDEPDARYPVTWHDGLRSAVGADYRVDDRWTLHAGYAYDNSAVDGSHGQSVLIPAADIVWYAAGASLRLSAGQRLDFSYAFLDYQDAAIAQTTTAPYSAEQVNTRGEWDMSLHLIGIQYSAQL